MSGRPNRLPEWAVEDAYPADASPEASSPNKDEPTDALKTYGHRPLQRPSPKFMNDWQNLVYRWIASGANRLSQIHQHWRQPMFDAWTDESADGGSIDTVFDNDSDRPGLWLQMRSPGEGTAISGTTSNDAVIAALHPDAQWVAEFSVDTTDIEDDDEFRVAIGLMGNAEATTPMTGDGVRIYLDTDDSLNWIFQSKDFDGGQTNVDTNVAAIALQRFRIVGYGANVDGDGARVELYIDDELVATIDDELPTDGDNGMMFVALFTNDSATPGNVDVYLSPVTLSVYWP